MKKVFLSIFGFFVLFTIYHIVDAGIIPVLVPKRPLTVKQGSYTGVVLDDATGQPIEGAAVYMIWNTRRRFSVIEGMLSFDHYSEYGTLGEVLAFTGSDGRYAVPDKTFRQWKHWRTKVLPVEVLIYKKDYVAYDEDSLYFPDGPHGPQTMPKDYFLKSNNVVRLKPWQDDYLHWTHLNFINNTIRDASRENQDIFQDLLMWEEKIINDKEIKEMKFNE